MAGGIATGQISLEELGTPLYDVSFCVLDLETTGGSPRDCEITEIGAVRYRHGEVDGTFQTLVNPGTGIPPFITILTGITEFMVREAPRIEAVLPSFIEFCQGAVIVGHNVRFDLSFLDAACRRFDYSPIGILTGEGLFGRQVVDTVGLARRLIRSEVRELNLAALSAYTRSPVTPTHRALDDARATAHVFHFLLERAGSLGVTGLDDLLALPTARGSSFYSKIKLTDALPRRPGVYLFKDRQGEIIYVGKADNLRTRVRSYFYGDERRSIGDMLRQLDRVEHRVTVNSLEAEVTELRLIHSHRPRFNRRSRPPRRTLFVRLTKERYPRLSMAHKFAPEGELWLGPFRSKQSADLVIEALWAATAIRRCRGGAGSRGARCAPAQMGISLCPCAGDLDVESYRAVVRDLLEACDRAPERLLDPLETKMKRLASEWRFEEAAQMRDRHRALARSLERRQAWLALLQGGRIELEDINGERVLIEDGRFSAAWPSGSTPPLFPAYESGAPLPVPPSVAAAEEAHLIWRWITTAPVTVVDATGSMSMSAARIQHLTAAA
jgi:DNA polymerase-3 subunit epsilon